VNVKLLVKPIAGLLIFTSGLSLGYQYRDSRIISIRDMQKKIGCIKVDGKLGPMWKHSETQAKWMKEYYKQYRLLMY